MFILGNFLEALATVVSLALQIYMWIVIARAVVSWVNPDPYNAIVQFLYRSTDPILYRIRRWIPVYGGGIDFSPIILIMAIIFLQKFLVETLMRLAWHLK